MGIFRKTETEDDATSEVRTQYEQVLRQLAKVQSQLTGLREERDNTSELNSLKRQIATLTIQKDKLEEDNARKIREAEHKAGLLLTGQEQEILLARRQTELEVREGNLKADQDRFAEHMKFRDEHFKREIDRFSELVKDLMERIPTFEVTLDGGVSATPADKPRAAAASRKPAAD
jgi:hypothetical protein